ncbi:hypothetical protein JCM8547_000352 [Rhodosporidiobolus lusitaniae]
MLDRLPVELLLDILELTLPPETAYSAYRERQNVLHDYSRVSKAVCQVAQPLLWRVFRPKGNLTTALKRGGDLVERVRAFHADVECARLGEIFSSVEHMLSLVKFRLEGGEETVKEEQLAKLTKLEELVLGNLALPTCLSLRFANIVSLSLHSLNTPNVSHNGIHLLAASCPSLHALYLATCHQLDMLQIHEKDHEYFPDGITQLPVPTLLSIDIFSLSSSSMVNRHSLAFDFEHFLIERFDQPSTWTVIPILRLVVSSSRLKFFSLPYHTSSNGRRGPHSRTTDMADLDMEWNNPFAGVLGVRIGAKTGLPKEAVDVLTVVKQEDAESVASSDATHFPSSDRCRALLLDPSYIRFTPPVEVKEEEEEDVKPVLTGGSRWSIRNVKRLCLKEEDYEEDDPERAARRKNPQAPSPKDRKPKRKRVKQEEDVKKEEDIKKEENIKKEIDKLEEEFEVRFFWIADRNHLVSERDTQEEHHHANERWCARSDLQLGVTEPGKPWTFTTSVYREIKEMEEGRGGPPAIFPKKRQLVDVLYRYLKDKPEEPRAYTLFLFKKCLLHPDPAGGAERRLLDHHRSVGVSVAEVRACIWDCLERNRDIPIGYSLMVYKSNNAGEVAKCRARRVVRRGGAAGDSGETEEDGEGEDSGEAEDSDIEELESASEDEY